MPSKNRTPKTRDHVVFYLNGKRHSVFANQASMMLSDYLRYEQGLTGTKVVCAEGDCGACSVLRMDFYSKIYLPVNSCIVTVAQLDGSSLVTVDVLGDVLGDGALSPVQSAMVESHGSQCGFCTPGFVIAITGLVEKKLSQKKSISAREAKNALTGNLCRCTGYDAIINAVTSVDLTQCHSVKERFFSKTQKQDLQKVRKIPVVMKAESYSFYAPRTLTDATKICSKNQNIKILSAGTDLGVVVNKGKFEIPQALSLHLIDELYKISSSKKRMTVGARVTLSELREALKAKIPEFSKFLDLFASPQIKNSATLVGNVANASPIGDTPPFLLVADAILHVAHAKSKRKIKLENFYVGYRKTVLKRGEIITAIEFDIPKVTETLSLFKTSQRKDLDISAVNAAFRVEWADQKRQKIKSMKLALGGVAATPLRIVAVEKYLKGSVDNAIIHEAVQLLQKSINPLTDLRGTGAFRRVMVENLFKKFFREALMADNVIGGNEQ